MVNKVSCVFAKNIDTFWQGDNQNNPKSNFYKIICGT